MNQVSPYSFHTSFPEGMGDALTEADGEVGFCGPLKAVKNTVALLLACCIQCTISPLPGDRRPSNAEIQDG